MAVSFRNVEKTKPAGQIPVELDNKIRDLAWENRRTFTEVLTEVMARGLGVDPSEYGLPSTNTLPQEHA